jgi:hypothetical protein
MNRQMVKLLILGLVLLATFTATRADAQGQPPSLPQAFFGAVEVNGGPAPVGAVVEARGAGVKTGILGNPLEVTDAGRYGGPTLAEPKLGVQGALEQGALIEFYVDGVKAECATPGGPWQGSFAFDSGVVTELNLRVGAAAQPTATQPQPTATQPQPTATPPQPTATPQQPTATPQQPTATPPQPTATPQQPTATPRPPTQPAPAGTQSTAAPAGVSTSTPEPAATASPLPQGDDVLAMGTAAAATATAASAPLGAGQEATTQTPPLGSSPTILAAERAPSDDSGAASSTQETATPQAVAEVAPDARQAQLVRPTATPATAGASGDSADASSLLLVVGGSSIIGAVVLALVLFFIWRRR